MPDLMTEDDFGEICALRGEIERRLAKAKSRWSVGPLAERQLRLAAGTLCDGLAKLRNNQRFWETLHATRQAVEARGGEISELFENMNALLAREGELLERLRVPKSVQAILTEDVESIRFTGAEAAGTLRTLSGDDIDRLGQKLREVNQIICDQAQSTAEMVGQRVRTVWRGAKVVGGGAFIGFNAAGELTTPTGGALLIASGGVGYKVITGNVDALLDEFGRGRQGDDG